MLLNKLVGVALVALTAATSQAADKGGQPARQNFEPEMVRIAPGSFMMGSERYSNGNEYVLKFQTPVHRVDIGYAFEIGKTEVTQGQWKEIMGEYPSHFSKCGDDCPVENVSIDDIRRYLKRLNIKTHKEYRLPSEAEWEYACRAGGNDRFCGGAESELDKVGWYEKNSGKETSPVAAKRANAWGLYDMTGNVFEIVQDCWHDSYQGAPSDGAAWVSGKCEENVARGGGYGTSIESDEMSAYRRWNHNVSGDYSKSDGIGFRVVRTLP